MIKAVTELLETGFRAFPVVCYFTWISKFVQNILFRTKRNQPSNLHCTPLTCFLSYNKICALNCSRVTYDIKITGWFPQCLTCLFSISFHFYFISVSFVLLPYRNWLKDFHYNSLRRLQVDNIISLSDFCQFFISNFRN